MAMTKIKGLQMWCKKMAEGYPLVDIANFTTAWRDGLAFCAIIHRFRPDLIDFHSLSPDDVFENCKLAFEIAERELNIPAFLEAEDMVRLKVPDKLSIITYVSQYYNYLHALPQLGGPGVKGKVSTKTISGTKRPTDSDTSQAPITKKPTTESKENLAPANEKPTAGGDKCAICQNHVYLVERHMDSGKLYHRSCFRRSEMSPANKVLTRSPFLSPSLSFDTPSSTALDVDNKHYRVEKSSKDVNNHKQEVQPTKTTSDSSFFPKKVENVGVKHTFNEPIKVDPKKAKMEPRTLFHDDKSKMISAIKDNTTAENMFNNNSDSGNYLSKSNKETLNGEKRPQDVQLSEKMVELSKSDKLKFQHKDTAISDTPRSTVTVPATTSSINIIKKDHPETKSATAISKTFNTPLSSQSGSEVQSKYKHTGNEGTQKSSFESKSDSSLSKANPLPSVQDLQKTFSGKSDLDLREPSKSSHPVARPRSGTLKSIVEDSTASPKKPAYTTADATPKAAPRRSMLEVSSSVTTVAPKQQGVSTPNEKSLGTDGTKMGTPRFANAELPPPIPKSAPPPLPTSVPSGGTTSVAGDKDFKRPQADKLFQETKASLNLTKITEDPKSAPVNTNHNQYQRTNLNKTTTQEHIKIHHAGISSNSSDDKVLSGLLSSLAGVRGQVSATGPTNHASQSPAKIPSQSFGNNKTQSESISVSSSKTPVNKVNITTLTPAKLPQKSTSQIDTLSSSSAVKDSTKNHINNDETNNAKSRTEKSVVLQVHNDSALQGKTFSSIQTPNKTQEPVGTPRFTHQAAGTPSITASNNITRAELKLNKPANINNEPKPGLSYIVDAYNKDQTTSKVQPQKNNQISHLKFSEENTVTLKNAEKKSQSTETKYDSRQTSSTAESKSVPYSKNKGLSASKEDLLDINSVKLKVVMPEQKKVQEPRTAVYDVKLKKVDVIKGDTRWDNTPGKPLKSVNASEGNKNTGIYAFSGDQIEGIQKELVEKPSGSITKDSSVGNFQKSGISSEITVRKKDVEENNNKFRSQSQTEINQLKDLKGVNDKKMAVHVEKKVDVDSKKKAAEIQNTSDGLVSLHKRPGDIKSGGKDLLTNVESKRNSLKLSPNIENKGNGSKLDWQLEAEKRMAALAGFDLEIVEKLKEPNKPTIVSSGMIGNQPNKMYGKSEGDGSTNNDKTHISDRKFNSDTLMSGDSNAQGKSAVIEKTSTTKSKESGLEFVLNKTKLKSVEVDISILPDKEIESHANHDDRSKGEDFRSILHQLKRVPAIESGKLDTVKPNTGVDVHRNAAALDIHPPSVAKPSQPSTVNVNNNNNNRPATTDQNKLSGAETVNKLSSNERTPLKSTCFQVSTDSPGIEKKNKTSELPKEKLALGKFTPEKNDNGRIKITTLGKSNKVTAVSPPASPVQKKKIPVTRKFDFEQSSDFEHSLTNSTAKLTIQEKHTTPPAPRSHHVGPSPNHISAIELQNQLLNIDVRLTELELKGREIEETIRKVDSLEDDEDQLMIQWFSVINEKNDLVRMEADLIYVSREQDLENEQDKIEHQLRYLMSKPDESKSPEEKEEEDYLLKHKLTLVEQRNKIVDSMDEDRIRYEDEDRGIEVTLKKKGLWKDSTGTLKALKGKKVAKSVFYT